MTTARTFTATLLLFLAASALGAQSATTTGKELTIEQKFLRNFLVDRLILGQQDCAAAKVAAQDVLRICL